jgi:hypothetical protein
MAKPDADLAVGMERYTGCIDRIDCPGSPYSCKTHRVWIPQKVCISQASNGSRKESDWLRDPMETPARRRQFRAFSHGIQPGGSFPPFASYPRALSEGEEVPGEAIEVWAGWPGRRRSASEIPGGW